MIKGSDLDLGGWFSDNFNLGSAVGTLWDGLVDAWHDITGQNMQQQQFEQQMAFAQQQANTQLDLAQNGMQYKVADYEAAGLSKWAAVSGSAAGVSAGTVSAPSSSVGTVNPGSLLSLIPSLLGQINNSKELKIQDKLADAQIEKYLSDAKHANAETDAIYNGSFLDQLYGEHFSSMDALAQQRLEVETQYWSDQLSVLRDRLSEDITHNRNTEELQRERVELDRLIQSYDVVFKQLDVDIRKEMLKQADARLAQDKELTQEYYNLVKTFKITGTGTDILKILIDGGELAWRILK